jgi:predicted ATPase
VDWARELSHPFSLAHALTCAGEIHLERREVQTAQEYAEAVIAIGTEQGFAHWVASGTLQRGCALAEQGQREEGIAQMRQGLAAYRTAGAEIGRPVYLARLATALVKARQPEEGLAVLTEALNTIHTTGERVSEAWLYLLKGWCLLALPTKDQAEAEACFRRAIDVARLQQAKAFELRAVMGLARLWQQQGKKGAARQLLADIYGWFTEGFDTGDLKEARALLEQLA